MSYESVPRWIREIADYLKTPEICNEVVVQSSYTLKYVPEELKTQEMCNWVMSLIILKQKRCVKKPLKMSQGP